MSTTNRAAADQARFMNTVAELAVRHVIAGESPEQAIVIALGEYRDSIAKLRAALDVPEHRDVLIRMAADAVWNSTNGVAS